MLFGSISVIFGISIYYVLPLAMLSMNLSMILSIFFFILVGMILGLTLLSFNFQGLLEYFLSKMLFWETKSVSLIVYKNLIAHK